MTLDRAELDESPLSDLHAIASELGIEGYRKLRRSELIDSILADGNGASESEADAGEGTPPRSRARGGRTRSRRGGRRPKEDGDESEKEKDSEGDREPDGDADSGRQRPPARQRRSSRQKENGAAATAAPDAEDEEADADEPEEPRTGVLDILPNGSGFMRPDPFAHSADDVYVSPSQIRRCELRSGDRLEGPVRRPRRSERHPSLVRVEQVNGGSAEPPGERRRFDDLTPQFASRRLEAPPELDGQPFGRGSRVAIGGAPGAGTTTLLRRVALALAKAHGDVELIVVLVGVRPEEVPEWRAESSLNVVGGGFDRSVDEQAQAAELAVELAKRAVESGRDAAIVIDSLDALPPGAARRVLSAARATTEAGSLTVIAATGLAGEPLRLATTRILLEPPGADGAEPQLGPTSGTLRAERLK